MSRRRRCVTVLAGLAAALALSGCQSRMGVAAVVGDQRITDDQLQSQVKTALGAPGVRDALPNSNYKGDLAAYRRVVLGIEVERLLAEAAAERLGIVVGEAAITERYRVYEEGSGNPTQFAAELASKDALSPALFRKLVRNEVIEAEIGYRAGGARRPSEAELRSLYQQYVTTATTTTLSLIQLPDEATARAVLARVQQDPESFTAVAKEYAQQQRTSSDPQQYQLAELPPDLAAKVGQAKAGEVFTYVATGNGTSVVFVVKFGGVKRPTFESSKAQLQRQSVSDAAKVGQRYMSTLASEVGIQINPRYGTWDSKQMMITDFVNPVVKSTRPPPPTGAPGAPGAEPPVEPTSTGG